MRIALLPEGTRGDVQPLLVLAAELARGGHSPVLFGPPDFEALADGRGVSEQVERPNELAELAEVRRSRQVVHRTRVPERDVVEIVVDDVLAEPLLASAADSDQR